MTTKTSDKKHLYWVIGLIIITLLFCGTLIWINYNSWTLRFEMDDNTLEAVKSINWTSFRTNQDISKCNYPLDCPESINNSPDRNCEYMVKCWVKP